MNAKLLVILLGFLISFCVSALQTEHMLWEKAPLAIGLPLNEERVIRFPSPISIVDSELDEDLNVLKIDDALYIKARKPFHHKRLIVQLMPDGELLVLNLSANESALPVAPIEIMLSYNQEAPSQGTEEQTATSKQGLVGANEAMAGDIINPVSLTRFAIQSLYVPERLLYRLPGVVRVAMQTQKTVQLVYGASVSAHPLISWQANELYVTAVELKNDLTKTIVLDPRQLIGEWQTATFYPTNTLKPRAHHETTTVFLVSSRPFGDALKALKGYVR
ncbi:integrating conjugative element protein, PFL_4704 family [Legionella busanensis]|uniref:Integrating conjugative element protein, PFL_4704 family n=1 Tax=Legionella busanensis TaxID=190655 RepID=A0A378KB60_9GAMM|nr:TIGR03749 family integrating conjugative element protein [Legionella busanensis]STX81570.1 integrating conjugative element protein, PFL_4704 family [Legionella busanensis]